MSRTTQNSKKYKNIIVNHFHRNYIKDDVVRMLENEYQIKIAERTLQRKLID